MSIGWRQPRVYVPLVFFLAVWGLTTHGKYSVTGDQPHYLLVAESLLADHDLDLTNNYAVRDASRFGADGLWNDGHARLAPDGELRSVHDLGVPLLVLPAYAFASRVAGRLVPERLLLRFRMPTGLFVYSLVSLFMLALTASAFRLLVPLAGDLAGPRLAGPVTLAVALSPPVLSAAYLVFPEVPALLVCALVVWAAYRRSEPSDDAMIAAIAALTLLPWFHRKYVLLASGLLFVLLVRRAGWWRARSLASRAALVGLFLVGPAALFLYTREVWGNLAGPQGIERIPLSWAVLKAGALGLLVDREYGLLPWAPIYLILPAAWWVSRRATWPLLLPAALLFLPSAAHDMWWGGWSPITRYLVPLIPVFFVPLAMGLRLRALRIAAVAMLVAQVPIDLYAWQHPRVLWPLGNGVNLALQAFPVVGRVQWFLPSFPTSSDATLVALCCLAGVIGLNALLVLASSESSETLEATGLRPRSSGRSPAPQRQG